MSISTPFILRPVATTLLMAAILLVGAVAYPLLPRAPLPQVDFPTIQVNATLPGASPETMASSVVAPLERQFSQIAGVSQMTSTSSLGVTTIIVQFVLSRNIDAAALDIQAAITAASGQLPKNLPSPPTFRKVNPADGQIMLIAVQSDKLPLTVVDDYADTIIAQKLSQIPGIAQILITGEQKPAVRVQIDPAKLASLGIGLEELRLVLAAATVNSPKGSFNGDHQSLNIYDNDQLVTAEPWNDVVIAYRNGSPVRVRDVGTAVNGPEDRLLAAWQMGKPGIQLIVFKQPGANVIETVDRVRELLPRLQGMLPAGLKVSIFNDRTQTIRASVADVQITLIVTIGLVIAVMFLFLRDLRATVIPSVTVPLSLIGTFAVMYLLGYSLDNLSLMALTIAVGFVVDDAIVMLENIHRHMEQGVPPMQAALKGAAEIGFTIISISASLVAVFIPVLLMGGMIGRLFREFAVTVSITIIVSAVVSLTLTPMMCSQLPATPHDKTHGRLYRAAEAFFDGMLRSYDRGLKWVLRHQFFTLCTLFATMTAAIALYVTIPKGFFPQQDTGTIFGFTQAEQGVSFKAMTERHLALADIVAKDPDVESYSMSVGATGGSQTINVGRFWLNLKPRRERKASAGEIMARLRPKLAKVGGVVLLLQAQQDLNVGGRLARTQFQYTLQDANLSELNEWAPKLLTTLRSLPQLQDVASDQQINAPTVTMVIDRDTAARFGFQPQVINDTLYDAFGQRQIVQFFTQLSQYNVIMEIDPKLQQDPAALSKIYIKSPLTGQPVALATFVKIDTMKTNYLSINHQGQFPSVTLSFNLSPGTALGTAVDAIQRAEREMGKPGTLLGSFQGTAQAFQQSLRNQPYLVLAAIVVMYIILGILYESYIHPLTILSTLPSAGVGALLILMAFGYDFSTIGLIGILLLIGIVKKNAIMMIDFALAAERQQNMTPEQSIYQACLVRFRPIMMTTMAALLGGVPLMLDFGTGSELRRPLGFAIVGGLLLSQLLTLYTTPVVYLYMARLSKRKSRARDMSAAPRRGEQSVVALRPGASTVTDLAS